MSLSFYLVNEIPDVPRVRGCRPDGVLGLRVNGSLIQPSDSYGLDGVRFHGIRLLELAQVIVLQKTKSKTRGRWASRWKITTFVFKHISGMHRNE